MSIFKGANSLRFAAISRSLKVKAKRFSNADIRWIIVNDPGLVVIGGGLGGSTTHPKVTADQRSRPWKFHSNWFTLLKDIHDFLYHRWTDGQRERQTNSIQNKSPLYPIQVLVEIFYYPVFLSRTKLRLYICNDLKMHNLTLRSLFKNSNWLEKN